MPRWLRWLFWPVRQLRRAPTAKLSIQYATMKVVAGDPARAARIVEIIDSTLAEKPTVTWTPETMAAQIKSVVDWQKLDQADRFLVNSLINVVATEVALRVPPGNIGVPRGEVAEVLGWVREAALISARR